MDVYGAWMDASVGNFGTMLIICEGWWCHMPDLLYVDDCLDHPLNLSAKTN
jgi:hypothetical protein